jgi:hypothetical protein
MITPAPASAARVIDSSCWAGGRVGHLELIEDESLAREEQRLTTEKSAVEDEWRRRREQRGALQAATTLADPPLHRTADRPGASGAPLWRLVDWQPRAR